MDERSVSPLPDRVPGPPGFPHATCQGREGGQGSPCQGTLGLQPHTGRVHRIFCCSRAILPRAAGAFGAVCPLLLPLYS